MKILITMAAAVMSLFSLNLHADSAFEDPTLLNPPVGSSYWGSTVEVDGDHLAVGAYDSNRVDLYDRVDGEWVFNTSLGPTPSGTYYYGYAIALDGNTMVVGAFLQGSGAVYIYEKDPDTGWQQTQLIQENLPSGSAFGFYVDLQDGTLAISVRYQDNFTGSARIYTQQDDGTFVSSQELWAEDGEDNDNFGRSLCLEGDLLVISAYRDDDNGVNSGSAYVYTRDVQGVWNFESKLLASNGAANDQFGFDVQIDFGRILIGANERINTNGTVGTAYLFERDDSGAWSETAQFVAPDGEDVDNLGNCVAIQNDKVVLGDIYCDEAAYNGGAAYVWNLADGQWQFSERLIGPGVGYDHLFTWHLRFKGDDLIISAPGAGNGVVYSYRLIPTPEFATATGEVLGHKKDTVVRVDSTLTEGVSAAGLIFVLERDVDGVWTFVTQETGIGATPPQLLDMMAGPYKPSLFIYRTRLLDAAGVELDVSDVIKPKVVADLDGDGKVTKKDYEIYLANPFDFDLDGDLDSKDKEAFLSWLRRNCQLHSFQANSLP